MIALAFDGPIPGNAVSSSCVAVLRFTPASDACAMPVRASVATNANAANNLAVLCHPDLMPRSFRFSPRIEAISKRADEHAPCRPRRRDLAAVCGSTAEDETQRDVTRSGSLVVGERGLRRPQPTAEARGVAHEVGVLGFAGLL